LLSKLLGLPVNGNGNGNGQRSGQTKRDVTPQVLKEQLLNALTSLFFELAEREAVILVIEDIQWTDPTTLELLSKIVQEAPSSRMLAIFTARPSFVPPWKPAEVLQMQLGRFGRDEIHKMVAGLTDSGEAPSSSLLGQIADRTDG